MFRGLINDAKSAAVAVVLKYVARASVAVPFIIAVGFGIAALTMVLAERFGSIMACAMIAGGFTVVGIVAALAVKVKEHEEEAADTEAEKADTGTVASDAATQAALQAPLALLGALFSTPMGPTASFSAIKLLGRNLPLVVLLVLIGALFWPQEATDDASSTDEADARPPRPNGAHPPMPPI